MQLCCNTFFFDILRRRRFEEDSVPIAQCAVVRLRYFTSKAGIFATSVAILLLRNKYCNLTNKVGRILKLDQQSWSRYCNFVAKTYVSKLHCKFAAKQQTFRFLWSPRHFEMRCWYRHNVSGSCHQLWSENFSKENFVWPIKLGTNPQNRNILVWGGNKKQTRFP